MIHSSSRHARAEKRVRTQRDIDIEIDIDGDSGDFDIDGDVGRDLHIDVDDLVIEREDADDRNQPLRLDVERRPGKP